MAKQEPAGFTRKNTHTVREKAAALLAEEEVEREKDVAGMSLCEN